MVKMQKKGRNAKKKTENARSISKFMQKRQKISARNAKRGVFEGQKILVSLNYKRNICNILNEYRKFISIFLKFY